MKLALHDEVMTRDFSRMPCVSCGRFLVAEARALGVEVIDRCNLTVLQEPGQEDLVDFLAAHQVLPATAYTRLCGGERLRPSAPPSALHGRFPCPRECFLRVKGRPSCLDSWASCRSEGSYFVGSS